MFHWVSTKYKCQQKPLTETVFTTLQCMHCIILRQTFERATWCMVGHYFQAEWHKLMRTCLKSLSVASLNGTRAWYELAKSLINSSIFFKTNIFWTKCTLNWDKFLNRSMNMGMRATCEEWGSLCSGKCLRWGRECPVRAVRQESYSFKSLRPRRRIFTECLLSVIKRSQLYF